MSVSKDEGVKLHIKVMINKEKNKVLFAEAGSDFTDVLCSFLLVPLGTILKALNGDEAPALIGSLTSLYKGVLHLDSFHFNTASAKQMLLAPKPTNYENEYCHKLRLNINNPQPKASNYVKRKYDGVFTETASSFIISDDLQVMPSMPHSFMETLKDLGIDVAARDVSFGMKEIMALLRVSLVSRNPLTALILPGSETMGSALVEYKQGNDAWSRRIDERVKNMNPRKMILKAMIQKSTKKLVFAQANSDFVNFLFSLLTISLGRVGWILGCNSVLKNIDNLRRGIGDRSKNMHLNLKSAGLNVLLFHLKTTNEFSELNFAPREMQCHVKGGRMYMVSDDLTVSPLAMSSCLLLLDQLKISVSDVEEVELRVGLEEGLSILNAALTSTTALTDGLIKPKLKGSLSLNSAVSDGIVNQTSRKRLKPEC